MRRAAVLSPRGVPGELSDLASRDRLIARQRVSAHRLRRRVARRARWVAARVVALAALAAVGAGAVGGVRWLTRSPRFAVEAVEVTGQSRLTREEVAAAAAIVPGANIFTLDTRAVAARVQALPAVRRVDVIRALPRGVTLVVEERRPFTLVNVGRLHWVDEGGVDLGAAPRAVAVDAPVLSGLAADELGTPEAPASQRAARGLALLRLLLRSEGALRARISEIDVGRAEGPVLYTLEGVEVRLGDEEWDARLGRLQGVLAQVESGAERVQSIDLRFRDQVVLKSAVK